MGRLTKAELEAIADQLFASEFFQSEVEKYGFDDVIETFCAALTAARKERKELREREQRERDAAAVAREGGQDASDPDAGPAPSAAESSQEPSRDERNVTKRDE